MANPTASVPTESIPFSEEKVYWPLDPTDTDETIYTGEMMGMQLSDGYANHFDDTKAMIFLGTKEGIVHRLQSDTPAADFKELIRRPRLYSMPLASGSAAIPTDIGKAAYAADSGHVQLTASTYKNLAGMVVDISRSGLTNGVLALTGASSVVLAPPTFGALVGLVVQGFAGKTAGAAPNLSIDGGAGGAATATATAGGAGASFALTAGAGGATSGTGASPGGAGGDLTFTAGAGGNAAAGTGDGGAGGSITFAPGSGGTSAGGAAGVPGCFIVGGTNPRAFAFNLTRSTISNGGTVTDAQHRGAVLYQDASGGNVTMTTRTGTQLAAAFPDLAVGNAILQHVASNHATNTSTIAGGTDVTLVGSGAVTQTGGTFLLVKTAATTFDLVRVG